MAVKQRRLQWAANAFAILLLAAAAMTILIRPSQAQLAIDVPKSGVGSVLATITFDDGQKVDVDVPTTADENEQIHRIEYRKGNKREESRFSYSSR